MVLSKAIHSTVLVAALVAAAAFAAAPGGSTEVAVKERANAYASLAASGRFAALAWGASTKDGVTDIYVTASTDGGRAFGAPTRVNREAGGANLSGEQPPRITLVPRAGRSPSVVVVWTAKSSAGTRLLSSRSDDGGRSFGPTVTVPGSEASGNRGWESIAARRDGGVVAVWLDHRELSAAGGATAPMNHGEHQHGASVQRQTDGVARAQLSKLYFGPLDDDETDDARALAGGVCYCCKTALATDARGVIHAAWRHVFDGSVRDIAYTRSSDGGRTFSRAARVSDDHWVLDGCPENGPALAVDDRQRVHVVWPTLVDGGTPGSQQALALFYAMSEDGQYFTPRQRIPTDGAPRHPQIALGPHGDVVVVWDEQSAGVRRIALARAAIEANGSARFTREPVGDGAPATYPVLAPAADGTIVAWTSGPAGETVVRTVRLAN
jgi:hypothetical protein